MTHEQHQNVSSLVSDLVQMAEATRRLPEVERELADMRSASSRDGDTIARLERKLMDRSAEIDELRAKLRSVEAERDDAGFRQLEAEDKSNDLHNVVEGVLSTLGETLGMTDGTDRICVMRMTEIDRKAWLEYKTKREIEWRAQQERSVEEARIATSEQSKDGSTQAEPGSAYASDGTISLEPFYPESQPTDLVEVREEPRPSVVFAEGASTEAKTACVQDAEGLSPGQSDPLPTAPMQPIPEPPISTTATLQDGATFNEPVRSLSESVGRYAGKKYHDHPYYVSEESWVANGGTLEDYHWKPAANA